MIENPSFMGDQTSKHEKGSPDLLERGCQAGFLTPLDRQFAIRVARLFGEAGEEPRLRWALAIACHQEAGGHVCADLRRLARDGIHFERAGEARMLPLLGEADDLEAWLAGLRASLLVSHFEEAMPSGLDEVSTPLVLDASDRLYLARAYRHQVELARRILFRVEGDESVAMPTLTESLEASIDRLVGDVSAEDPTRHALRVGLTRRLAIVTGGPGTGKTTLVARLVALLTEEALQAGRPAPRVRLLAPTGKAAAAMAQSFERGRDQLRVPEAVRAALPDTAETIHRALHGQTRLDAFGRMPEIGLEEDVVVVDEASMVDLELMNRLFAACENVPRLILLGDPDQLASVDAGAVLSELCWAGASGDEGLAGTIVRLTHSHRFDAEGAIGRLATAVREGDADRVIALLHDPTLPEIERCDAARPEEIVAQLAKQARGLQDEIYSAALPREKLDQLAHYRVLCAHRRGPLGVEVLSARLDEMAARFRHASARSGWWGGRLLLVNRNAPEHDLWNGDVGLVEETEDGLRALFPDGHGGVRALSAGRLPSHESAIAMSVHKSQGSEFDTVDLVIGDRASPITTRELLYTGITRARKRLRIHASEAALRDMIDLRIHRDSGLADLLWAD